MEKPFSAYKGDGPYVFVCYAHEDSDAVFREIGWLCDYGVNVWYDEGISPGHEWREELASAIQGCTRVLFFVTPRSVLSEHCRRELNFAQEENREVVAVYLEPTEVPAGLRLGLNNRQAIVKHDLPEEEFHKRLMRVVHSGVGPASGSTQRAEKEKPRSRAGLAFAAIALIAVVVGAWWVVTRGVGPADIEPEGVAAGDDVSVREVSRDSIAVLPFVNMSSDPEQEYFSDGISEELLNLLAKNPELKVISRSSAFTFKGKDLDIPTVARQLGVAHVLEGSVRKAGDTIRVTAQLIDAETDTHLWSETYDRKLDDVFAIQDEIATHVVEQLKVTLFGSPTSNRDINLDAYSLYLQGRHLGQAGTPETLRAAEAMLKQALAIDPNYAEAWLEISRIYFRLRMVSAMPGKEAERLGRQAVERARAIDPENAEIYGELAFMAMFVERDFKSAAQYLEQGLALEPTNLRLISHAALLSLNLGRLADAQVLYEYITAHDPLCAFCFVQLGSVYILEGKLELAERAHETYELLGGVGDGHLTAALTLLLQGRHEASMAAWARSNPGPFRAYGETITLYSMGRNEEFEARFQAYRDQYGADYPTMVARVYAWMGDADAAFEWLGRYHVEQPELGPIIGNFWEFLSVELNSLHDDPRWQEHLERLGIAPKQLAAFEFAVPLPK